MTTAVEDQERTPLPRLAEFIERALSAVDLPAADAKLAAALMAEADLNGSDGHGVFRLPQYIKRIRAGGLNVTPNIRIVRERAATALIDGDNAMGHLVMHRAAQIAIEKARTTGVAWAGSRHSNHAGPAALYARMALEADMIGLYVAVANANHMPPWGGTDMLLGTNPIAVAIPGLEEPPIVLDMATTVAAYGKVKTAAQRGEAMPVGWMIDRQGQPLTDPARSKDGFLLPIGGAKGYGLSLVFGLLAGTLNGAAFGRNVVDFNADSSTPTNTGQFIIALSIDAFTDVASFKRDIDAIARDMRQSPTLPGFDQVRLPGDASNAKRLENAKHGIPIHSSLRAALNSLADELGISPL